MRSLEASVVGTSDNNNLNAVDAILFESTENFSTPNNTSLSSSSSSFAFCVIVVAVAVAVVLTFSSFETYYNSIDTLCDVSIHGSIDSLHYVIVDVHSY